MRLFFLCTNPRSVRLGLLREGAASVRQLPRGNLVHRRGREVRILGFRWRVPAESLLHEHELRQVVQHLHPHGEATV